MANGQLPPIPAGFRLEQPLPPAVTQQPGIVEDDIIVSTDQQIPPIPPGFRLEQPIQQPITDVPEVDTGFISPPPQPAQDRFPTIQELALSSGIPQIAQSIGGKILGGVETGAALVSGAIAEPISGLAGIAGTLLPGTPGQGARFVEATQEALTFQPRTDPGRAGIQAVGELLQPVGEQLQRAETTLGESGAVAGQALAQATGLPVEQARAAGFAAGTTLPTLALEAIGFFGANTVRGTQRITGIPNDVEATLRAEGLSIDDLSPENVSNIQNAVNQDAIVQIERAEILRSQGIEPTRAQITRDASDFQEQQELVKRSGRVREAIEGQEALLVNRFDESIAGTGGQPVTSGSSVTDAVINRSTELDNQISELYKRARDIAPGEKNVRMSELASLLRSRAPSNDAAKGLIKSIRGHLIERGVLDKEFRVIGRVDVDTAEEVRKFINRHFDSTSDLGKGFMREFKNALDRDVFRAAGTDIFEEARTAKANFEKDLNRAKVSRFDKRRGSLVREILENKIDPDKLAAKIADSSTVRAKDVQQLKTYLIDTGTPDQRIAGKKAWNDLRAETLNSIKEKAFIGPIDSTGNKALSRASLESSIKKLGNAKRDVLFTPRENKFINDMLKVSKLREPVRGTVLGRGPTAQAVDSLKRRLDKIPLIGDFLESISIGQRGKAALKGKPKELLTLQVEKGKAPGIATAGVITGIIEESKKEQQQVKK